MKRRIVKLKNEQPYRVGKRFVKWMDEQIAIMERWESLCKWEAIENECHLESYRFIRGLIKP